MGIDANIFNKQGPSLLEEDKRLRFPMLLQFALLLLVTTQKVLNAESSHDNQQLPQRNNLLVIVLDGFRWDYFKIYKDKTGKDLEGFKRFMSAGVRTEYLESVFLAESFPAWQTIQTGLYPESHGIVGNQFYDSEVHKMTDSTYL